MVVKYVAQSQIICSDCMLETLTLDNRENSFNRKKACDLRDIDMGKKKPVQKNGILRQNARFQKVNYLQIQTV